MAINLSTLVNQTNALQLCKAWVNFNGTTVTPSTIRSSYNVLSVTKNGTGDYTINFTTPLADANYSATGSASVASSVYTQVVTFDWDNANSLTIPRTTTQLRLATTYPTTNGATNNTTVCVQVFGN